MPTKTSKHEAYLGVLAMKFRGTRDNAERQSVASEYAKTVKQLLRGGTWHEMPPPEGQLPHDSMPKEFFEFWSAG